MVNESANNHEITGDHSDRHEARTDEVRLPKFTSNALAYFYLKTWESKLTVPACKAEKYLIFQIRRGDKKRGDPAKLKREEQAMRRAFEVKLLGATPRVPIATLVRCTCRAASIRKRVFPRGGFLFSIFYVG